VAGSVFKAKKNRFKKKILTFSSIYFFHGQRRALQYILLQEDQKNIYKLKEKTLISKIKDRKMVTDPQIEEYFAILTFIPILYLYI